MPQQRPPDSRTDDELMSLVQAGDAAAFGHVYDRYAGLAMALAYRILRERDCAEDAVQEALMAVWRGASAYDPGRGNLSGWILSIVRHRSIDAARKRQLVRKQIMRGGSGVGMDELEAVECTSRDVEQRDEAQSLRSAVDKLPPDQRRAIDLAYFGELTHTEIATRLDLPLGTVKGRVRLALNKLRRCEPSEGSLDPLDPDDTEVVA